MILHLMTFQHSDPLGCYLRWTIMGYIAGIFSQTLGKGCFLSFEVEYFCKIR